MNLPTELLDAPREFSLLPFWFWNDDLNEEELLRQIADFEAHGVYGFVIHARVGLPRSIGWMSERMLHFMRIAVEEAARRDMTVVLYDEGMYPSGSSCGQVVASDPRFQCRALEKRELAPNEEPALAPGENLVAIVERSSGERLAVVDRAIPAFIRGLHYIETASGEGPEEDEPPAADLLNPEAVACFLRLVHERYHATLGEYFGTTIIGIFTDEVTLTGRLEGHDFAPGTTGILEHVNRFLGYDFTPHLAALWHDDEPDAAHYRSEYVRAVDLRFEETYYQPLSQWCEAHGVALMGHPNASDAIGIERYFHIPGQDIVWRRVLPCHNSALEGKDSTQAKCSSSAMIHQARRRNSNECYGAYGHGFTFEEMKWLADWCFVRGVNMLTPHAFYYSIRGPRKDERPPDVGPNSPWWSEYSRFADYCRRLCWLNTDCRHLCQVAILGESDYLPWRAAKVCFQNQRDFNYLEMRDLWETARVTEEGIHLAEMHYPVLIIDGIATIPDRAQAAIETLRRAGRVLVWQPGTANLSLPGATLINEPQQLIASLDQLAPSEFSIAPSHPDLRCRYLSKNGDSFLILFNEGPENVTFSIQASANEKPVWIDLFAGHAEPVDTGAQMELSPFGLKILQWPGAA